MRARTYLLVFVLGLASCGSDLPAGLAALAEAPPLPAALADVPRQIAAAINAERTARGHRPLASDAKLTRAAGIQASQMAKLDTLSHVLPGTPYPTLVARIGAVGYTAAWAGENLAVGHSDPANLVRAWLDSGPHREVLLSRAPAGMGVALALTASGRPYYSVVLGRP